MAIFKMSNSQIKKPKKLVKRKRDGRGIVHDWNEVADNFKAYIDETQIPIVKEFCWKIAKIPYGTFTSEVQRQKDSRLAELSELCIDKKETQLERGGLSGILDKTMVIFSLKQLGWTDRQELTGKDGAPLLGLEQLDAIFQRRTGKNCPIR